MRIFKSNSGTGRKGAESRDIPSSLKSPAHSLLSDTKNKKDKNAGKKSTDPAGAINGTTSAANSTTVIYFKLFIYYLVQISKYFDFKKGKLGETMSKTTKTGRKGILKHNLY